MEAINFICFQQIGTVAARKGLNTRSTCKEMNEDPIMKATQYRMFKENLDQVLQKHLVDIKNVDMVYLLKFYLYCFLFCILHFQTILKLANQI